MINTQTFPNMYLRTLYVTIAFSAAGEAFILVFFGLVLFPQGDILYKMLWTLLFCGPGMGAVVGSLLNIFVVNRIASPAKSILSTAVISGLVLGVTCNSLCLNLDLHFHYFGGHTNPTLFFVNGLVLSVLGGLAAGWLLFTTRGNSVLTRIGI